MCGSSCRDVPCPQRHIASNETVYTAGYRRGRQDEAFETYFPNLAATEARVAVEVERAAAKRWGE